MKQGSIIAQYTRCAVVGKENIKIKARQLGQFLPQEYMALLRNDNICIYVPYYCAIQHIVLTKALNKIFQTCLLDK